MDEEIFDIVDAKGTVIAQASRGEVHGNRDLIHQSVHCLLFNSKGELYLQKRSMNKDIQPGKWDSSVGGHVDTKEAVFDALKREVLEELGIQPDRFIFLHKYLMKSEVETELVYTYKTIYDGDISPDPEEIIEGKFWSFSEIEKEKNSGVFTPNFIKEWDKYKQIVENDMSDNILNGKKVALEVREEVRKEAVLFEQQYDKKVKLCVVIVGEDPASKVYVRNKKIACEKASMASDVIELKSETSQNELVALIKKLNEDESVHGILVQLPLPKHINEEEIIELINPAKDVDAFHPYNTGMLFAGKPVFQPCTPGGILELLKFYNINTSKKHVVIIGRSNIVGKPLAALLLMRGDLGDATVTVCHSRTKNLEEITKQADILVAAIGRANFVTKDMVKDGAIVIDVGINRVEDSSLEKGYKLAGDVDFDEVSPKAGYITPVPGGVGPMTIAVLLKNTLTAAKKMMSADNK